jgi:hypothetical protein
MAKAPGKEPYRFVDHTHSLRILRTGKGDSAKHRHAPYTKQKTDRILVNGVPWTPPEPLSYILSPEALEATKEIVDKWWGVLDTLFTTRFATPTKDDSFPIFLASQAIVGWGWPLSNQLRYCLQFAVDFGPSRRPGKRSRSRFHFDRALKCYKK